MKTLITDCHCLCHIAYHAHPDLSYRGISTGVIFGFLKSMLDYAEQFESNKFIFCWDSSTSRRREIFPEYKLKRHSHDMSMTDIRLERQKKEQFKTLRKEILPKLGFRNIFIRVGYEADDIMHSLVQQLSVKSGAVSNNIMLTSDNDMLQSLCLCTIYNPQKKIIVTAEQMIKELGVTPQQWPTVKAIGGCRTDEIPGVSGVYLNKKGERKELSVAESSAISYVRGELKGARLELIESEEGRRIAMRNMQLVRLPFRGLSFKLVEDKEFKKRNFQDVFIKYGLDSFLKEKEFKRWINAFKLKG